MTTENAQEQIAGWATGVQSRWGLLEKSAEYTFELSNTRGEEPGCLFVSSHPLVVEGCFPGHEFPRSVPVAIPHIPRSWQWSSLRGPTELLAEARVPALRPHSAPRNEGC